MFKIILWYNYIQVRNMDLILGVALKMRVIKKITFKRQEIRGDKFNVMDEGEGPTFFSTTIDCKQ